MVSILELKERLADGGDWVLFDSKGAELDLPVPVDIGPATLLVGPVTDAVKTTTPEGMVDRSLDRDEIWAVEGYALNRVVIDRLEPLVMTADELYEAVTALRLGWQVKPLVDF